MAPQPSVVLEINVRSELAAIMSIVSSGELPQSRKHAHMMYFFEVHVCMSDKTHAGWGISLKNKLRYVVAHNEPG